MLGAVSFEYNGQVAVYTPSLPSQETGSSGWGQSPSLSWLGNGVLYTSLLPSPETGYSRCGQSPSLSWSLVR